MADIDQVVKGGVTWLEISIGRTPKGMNIWVRSESMIEEFMKNLGDGHKDRLVDYRGWVPFESDKNLSLWRLNKDVISTTYALNNIGESFPLSGNGKVNLSFLRFVGISEPAGIKFLVPDPFSESYIRKLGPSIIQECKKFVAEYILPININLRISSHEV